MCDYEVISHEPGRLWWSSRPHGSSGCHWLVTMCLCLIGCEMVCCCTAVSHLRPTKVIDWFGHVECSHLVRSNVFFSPPSFMNNRHERENSWSSRKGKGQVKTFSLSHLLPSFSSFLWVRENLNRPSRGTWLALEEGNAIRKSSFPLSYWVGLEGMISCLEGVKRSRTGFSNVSFRAKVCTFHKNIFDLSDNSDTFSWLETFFQILDPILKHLPQDVCYIGVFFSPCFPPGSTPLNPGPSPLIDLFISPNG